MLRIFSTLPAGRQVRAFAPSWQTYFRSEAEKFFLTVIVKSLIFFMSASV